jgi:predicted AlkP superfamily phosphohydrolase/phosphomutase
MGPEVMEQLYVKMDDLVGRVLAKLDKKDVLIIMSDHGIKSFRRGINMNSWLYRNGYLALKEGKQLSEEWFKDVDWQKTKAYGLGLGGVYLNIQGRESQGTVSSGGEAKSLKNDIIAKLNGLKDEEKGQTAINTVFDKDDLPPGPYKDNCPDLIIGYNEGYRVSWDSVTGKVNDILFEDNTKAWSGDHCIDPRIVPGIIFCNRKINTESPAIIDIAPTVLNLFGLEAPKHMDGRNLIDMMSTPSKKEKKGKKNA